MDLAIAKDVSEVAKNVFQGLGFLALGAGAIKWLAERRDREADVILKLEERFDREEIAKGRRFLDRHDRKTEFSLEDMIVLEPLLRFYVALYAMHKVGQIRLDSIQHLYRYWLGIAVKENADRYNGVFDSFLNVAAG